MTTKTEAERTVLLRNVTRSSARVFNERAKLESFIRQARAAGVPLRTIAEAAGLSHEHVRRIAGEAK